MLVYINIFANAWILSLKEWCWHYSLSLSLSLPFWCGNCISVEASGLWTSPSCGLGPSSSQPRHYIRIYQQTSPNQLRIWRIWLQSFGGFAILHLADFLGCFFVDCWVHIVGRLWSGRMCILIFHFPRTEYTQQQQQQHQYCMKMHAAHIGTFEAIETKMCFFLLQQLFTKKT